MVIKQKDMKIMKIKLEMGKKIEFQKLNFNIKELRANLQLRKS